MAEVTYTKLRDGSWGLRGADIRKGDEGCTVTVQKKDGTTKDEVIDRVVWRGRDTRNGGMVGLATIRRPVHHSPPSKHCSCGNGIWDEGWGPRGAWCKECYSNWCDDQDIFGPDTGEF
jgi:hypothetical protein